MFAVMRGAEELMMVELEGGGERVRAEEGSSSSVRVVALLAKKLLIRSCCRPEQQVEEDSVGYSRSEVEDRV